MRQIIIAGNWKMNNTRQQAENLTRAILDGIAGQSQSQASLLPEIVLCPPFTCLQTVVDITCGSPLKVGAQNMEYRDSGAYTGEVSAAMLVEIGARYVLIGHSERRQYYGETDETVNEKLKTALKYQLLPIVCVGETLSQREANSTDTVVGNQIAGAIKDLTAAELSPLVIAYEPVWAIGTGKVCESSEAARVIDVIRRRVDALHAGLGQRVPVLYGGSVGAKNIDELLGQASIDGGLVGGASLKPDEFLAIVAAGQKRKQLVKSS
jgi:triosephosphate isomerase (TIM)